MKQIVDVQLLAERFMKRAVELAKADKDERKSYFEARKSSKKEIMILSHGSKNIK
ncbi:MAG: hypothetical protein IPK10_07565 [Bacteroidetes bacterium]|nr:hypothetical protein [Bacteroidota bacterium]